MSTIIQAACWPLQMPPTAKSVLISLADNLNDQGVCWPSIPTICQRTCFSERAVHRAIKWLEQYGLLHANRSNGRHTSYTLTPEEYRAPSQQIQELPPSERHPRQKCGSASHAATPAADAVAPPQMRQSLPSEMRSNRKEPSLEPSGNHQRVRARRAASARGVRLSVDWVLPKDWGEWARQEHPDWTPEQVQRVAAQFRDHWLAKAGADACKVDWQATWRNWIRRETSFSGAARTGGFGTGLPNKQAALEARNAQVGAQWLAEMRQQENANAPNGHSKISTHGTL